ncbi:MAG: hypothetical protein ACFBSE_03155 [Prochloraceae cyanobacterium]
MIILQFQGDRYYRNNFTLFNSSSFELCILQSVTKVPDRIDSHKQQDT